MKFFCQFAESCDEDLENCRECSIFITIMTETSPSFTQRIPPQDDRPRSICDHCGFIDYVNPRIVAGAVVRFEDRVLLCRRAIEPRKGFWTLPAGFMEKGEDVEEGARREAREEACADIHIDALLGVYSVPRISQVQMMFLAHLKEPVFDVGPESLEVGLFRWEEIPWDDLAFPTVHWALKHFDSLRDKIRDGIAFAPFMRTAGEADRPPE